MLDMLEATPGRPDFCIVGEPTEMQVGIAHKGKVAATCTCSGVSAHSALPDKGLNAIHLAAEMIQAIRGIQQRIRLRGVHDDHYSVPWSTLHVGTIAGGTALNIIPDQCRFCFEIRNVRQDDPDDLLEEIRVAADGIAAQYRDDFPGAAIDIAVDNGYPALDTSPEEPVVKRVQGILDTDDFIKLAFGTEGGLFQQRLGISTVICGPGSMDQGHKPDEFIARSELARCDEFLHRLLDQASGGQA
jgi:acetylornithine deacetylase